MKIYEFKWSKTSIDWVFAPNEKEAIEFYINVTSCGDVEGCEVNEVPKKDWKNMYILDVNESEPDEDEVEYNEDDYSCGYKIECSFAEYAARETQTDMIATTEY